MAWKYAIEMLKKYHLTKQEMQLLTALGVAVLVMVLIGFRLAFESVVLKPSILLHDNQLFLSQKNEYFVLHGEAYVPQRRVVALKSGSEIFVLHSSDLEPEPVFMSTWKELNQFYQRQTDLFNFIERSHRGECDPCMFWLLSSGHLVPTALEESTFSEVKSPFVMYMLLFVLISVVALLTWFYSTDRQAAFYFVMMGISLALMSWAEGIYVNRGLVLEGSIFQVLTTINVLGVTFFVAGMSGFIAVYPQKICRTPDLFVILAIFGFALIFFQILPDAVAGSFAVITFFMVIILVMLARQILSVQQDPVVRVQVKWLWLSILLGIGVLSAIAYLPYLLSFEHGVKPIYGLMGLFITYLMLSISLAYARLFDISMWWSRLWYFALWSFAAILVTLALQLSLDIDLTVAAMVGVAVSGWLALPVRRWVMHKSNVQQEVKMEVNAIVPRLIGSDLQSIEKVSP